jgi:hypothetical protein
VAPPTSIAAVPPELRQITRDLNLHVPPSYFTTSTTRMPYERALAPLTREDSGPHHLHLGVPRCEENSDWLRPRTLSDDRLRVR